MAKQRVTRWITKFGGPELRLANVDERATVDVGLSKKFRQQLGPGFRSEKWGGRGWLEISSHGTELNRPGRIVTHAKHGDCYECECTRMARGRRRGEIHRVRTGSLDYDVQWDTRDDLPETGYVEFAVDCSPDLVWHKQPALTQEQIDSGQFYQPVEAINAYVAYGSREGRILRPSGEEIVNYETGKFCSLMRPLWFDAAGNQWWGDQTITPGTPTLLRIPFPDVEWLSGAVFPLTLDPTFGYSSIGLSTDYLGPNTVYCFTASPASSGTCTSVSVYVEIYGGSEPRNATFGLYSDSGGSPSSLLADSAGASYSVAAASWKTQNLDSGVAVTGGTTYWNAFCCNPNWWNMVKFDGSGGSGYKYKSQTYSHGALLASISSPSSSGTAYKYSVYGTYTESSGVIPRIIRHRKFLGMS